MLVRVLVVCLVARGVQGWPTGAPVSRCEDMTPGHGWQPELKPNPFSIGVSTDKYSPGETLQVTVDGEKFQGLIMQARQIDSNQPLGTFSNFPKFTQGIACGGWENSAVTHTAPSSKPAGATFDWTAPEEFVGEIEFVATVLKNEIQWWKNIKSEKLTEKEGGDGGGRSGEL